MRLILLTGAVVLSVLVVLITEVLSLARALNLQGLLVAWGLILAAGLGVLFRVPLAREFLECAGARGRAFVRAATASRLRLVVIAALTIFAGAIAVVAWYAPPNTFDSMTYHMGRVAHWIQNGDVGLYATPISRQYEYPAFSEYVIAQLQLAIGSDRLANFVQWAAYVGSILGASRIAKEMGAGADAQLLTGAIVATIPMAVIQASGTQTDLVVSFWLTCAVLFILRTEKSNVSRMTLLIGASLGLAAFTKLPGALYALGILMWFTIRTLKRAKGVRAALPALVTVAFVIGLVNGAHYVRLASLSYEALRINSAEGNVTAATGLPVRHVNRTVMPQSIASNIVRAVGLHLGLPSAPWNERLTETVLAAHRIVGADANDADTTYPANSYDGIDFWAHEDEVGNLIHLALAAGAAVWVLGTKSPARPRWLEYLGMLAGIALVFTLVLKWEPWNSRLHTPLFVLAAPMIAAAIAAFRSNALASLVALGLLLAAVPFLFWGLPRPLLGEESVLRVDRTVQYFSNNRKLETPYRNAAAYLGAKGCREIGLQMGGNVWEYPLWVLVRESGPGTFRIEHVNMTNNSRLTEAARPPFAPCAIVAYDHKQEQIMYHDKVFTRRVEWAPLGVYEAK